MLPNFLVLGAPRTGTTWLHAVLSHHPQIHVPDTKEPDFLNRRILSEDFSRYTSLFDAKPGFDPKPLRGDMSVNYSHMPSPVVHEISRLLGHVKLVYTLRHPVERLWSNLKYTYGTFSGRVMRRPPLMKFLRACHSARFTRRNDYVSVMRIWAEAFGKENLHVDLYDRIESDSQGYVADVLGHLGADADWSIPTELIDVRIHTTKSLAMPDVFRWYVSSQWLGSARQLNEVLGGRVSHWIDSMEQAAGRTTLSRRLLREFNSVVLSLPERLAYAAYDARRNAALVRRFQQLIPALSLKPAEAGPARPVAARPMHCDLSHRSGWQPAITPSQSVH